MIDCISGGRVIAGFPVASPQNTVFAYGQNPSMLRHDFVYCFLRKRPGSPAPGIWLNSVHRLYGRGCGAAVQ